MKQRKRVTKSGRIVNLKASCDEAKSWRDLAAEIESLRKPGKILVTLHVDADVLAWFKEAGPGYQTRINRALRKVMKADKERISVRFDSRSLDDPTD